MRFSLSSSLPPASAGERSSRLVRPARRRAYFFAHPDSRIFHVDRDGLREFFAIGFVKVIGELRGDLVLARLQLERPLRLRLAIVLVRGVHWDDLALGHEGCGSIDDQVVVTGAWLG